LALSPYGLTISRPGPLIAALVVAAATVGIVQQTSAKAHRSKTRADSGADTYSVFARAATTQDDVASWHFPAPAGFGLRVAGARRVYTDSTKVVAAVPTGGGVPCLMTRFADGSGGLNCGDADGHTASLGYNGALGLVPDEVGSVTYVMSDGATQTGKVADNVWHSPADAAQVSFLIGGAGQTLDLMPASSAPKGMTVSPTGVVSNGSPSSGSGR
jgi:hypothetical protein